MDNKVRLGCDEGLVSRSGKEETIEKFKFF